MKIPCRVCRQIDLRIALLSVLVINSSVFAAQMRAVVDSAGRQVQVPARIERVFAAGSPACVFLYTLAPEKLLNWNLPLTAEQRAYIPARYGVLPALGRLSVETVLAARPDVILDYGTINPTYVSLADRIQKQTGVPYLLFDGSFDKIASTYKAAGAALGASETAEQLSAYAERLLGEVDKRLARVPVEKRALVYYARGPRGLETGLKGSINVESIERLRARNVAAERLGAGSLVSVSQEQLLAWNPEIVITIESAFAAIAATDDVWKNIRAVRERRIFVAPELPFPWIDSPPSVNRLIGLKWLGGVLYPAMFHEDLRAETRNFYSLFYHRTPDEKQLNELLSGTRRRAEMGPGVQRGGAVYFSICFAALVLLVVISFAVGRYPVSVSELLHLLWSKISGTPSGLPITLETVVFKVRGPRVLAAMIVGGALAVSGAVYQGLFRNPLVSPDILGVSSGAALGAVLGIYFSLGVFGIQALAFGAGLGAVAAVYLIGTVLRYHDPILTLVLAGVVIGTLLSSMVGLIKYLADPYNQLPAITFWLLGSLTGITGADLWAILPAIVVGVIPLYLLRWRMNVMTLGDEEAQSLGVDVQRIRFVVVAAATLMSAAAVSVSGIIGWIGLLIPHFARLLVGPDFGRLLPAALLLGAGYLLGVDTVARTISTIEVPLGVLTAFIGTPFFIWVLAVSHKAWR